MSNRYSHILSLSQRLKFDSVVSQCFFSHRRVYFADFTINLERYYEEEFAVWINDFDEKECEEETFQGSYVIFINILKIASHMSWRRSNDASDY